jgi:hypothetical protein
MRDAIDMDADDFALFEHIFYGRNILIFRHKMEVYKVSCLLVDHCK